MDFLFNLRQFFLSAFRIFLSPANSRLKKGREGDGREIEEKRHSGEVQEKRKIREKDKRKDGKEAHYREKNRK